MLGVCNGNDGMAKHKRHCDKSKDLPENKPKLPLTLNPLNEACERLTFFNRLGQISSNDPRIQQDLKVLNLNEQELEKNRKIVIDEVYRRLKEEHERQTSRRTKADGLWKSRIIKQELKNWEDPINDRYKEFCQAAIYFLKKELARVEG